MAKEAVVSNRVKRMEKAVKAVMRHDPNDSFSNLIDPNRDLFKDFRMIYSTDVVESNIGPLDLTTLETNVKAVKKYFSGKGCFFFSDEIYDCVQKGDGKVAIDYSLTFDSNVASQLRSFLMGKIPSPEEETIRLIKFIKEYNVHFDYTFFLVENAVHIKRHTRTYETIFALKKFDFFDYVEYKSTAIIKCNITDEKAHKEATELISLLLPSENPSVDKSIHRRKFVYLVLLKATNLYHDSNLDNQQKLGELLEFCVGIQGFAKIEMYFCWKLFIKGGKLRFFSPITQLTENVLSKISGMSWDIFALRHQETLTSQQGKAKFFIPFFVSFDKRFKELLEASPIRAVLLDDKNKQLHTIYYDDLDFYQYLTTVTSSEKEKELADEKKKVERMNKNLSEPELDNLIQLQELAVQSLG